MKISDVQSGDVLAVKGKGFPSPEIIYFMERYAKKNNIKCDWIGSHLAMLFWDKNSGRLFVAESVDNGFHFREFEKHYDFAEGNLKVLSPKIPYTEEQVIKMWLFAMHLQTINVGYQFINFAEWIAKIELKLNIFGKGNNKFTFCYESVYKILQTVNPEAFWKKEEKQLYSFFDVYCNPALYVKE